MRAAILAHLLGGFVILVQVCDRTIVGYWCPHRLTCVYDSTLLRCALVLIHQVVDDCRPMHSLCSSFQGRCPVECSSETGLLEVEESVNRAALMSLHDAILGNMWQAQVSKSSYYGPPIETIFGQYGSDWIG